MARYTRKVETITLAISGSATTTPVPCIGAKRVHIAISCDVTHQLSTANVRAIMADGKIVAITPAVFPGGTSATTHELNAAGVVTGIDLNSASNHRAVVLRSGLDAAGPYAASIMPGIDYVGLSLTKAATAGNAVYTVTTTVYWD